MLQDSVGKLKDLGIASNNLINSGHDLCALCIKKRTEGEVKATWNSEPT